MREAILLRAIERCLPRGAWAELILALANRSGHVLLGSLKRSFASEQPEDHRAAGSRSAVPDGSRSNWHRCDARRPGLLGRLRDPRDRRPTRGSWPDVHDRARQRSLRRGDRGLPASRRRAGRSTISPPISGRSGAAWRATRSCAGWVPKRASSISRWPRSSTPSGISTRRRAEAGVEAARRHDAGADRPLHRLPVHHRRAHARRSHRSAGARALDQGGSRAGCWAEGYPAYTTSAGWIGYSDERIREPAATRIADGWTHFKVKVGASPTTTATASRSSVRRSVRTAR